MDFVFLLFQLSEFRRIDSVLPALFRYFSLRAVCSGLSCFHVKCNEES